VDVEELVAGARSALGAKAVYAEPLQHNGLTVVPAAAVRGGAGGGGGESDEGKGSGAGFGLIARPVGAWILEDGKVTWKPAVDVNRIVLGGQIVALAALLTVRAIANGRAKRQPRFRLQVKRPAAMCSLPKLVRRGPTLRFPGR
jgi:uncharacterized spore protein YtfJ